MRTWLLFGLLSRLFSLERQIRLNLFPAIFFPLFTKIEPIWTRKKLSNVEQLADQIFSSTINLLSSLPLCRLPALSYLEFEVLVVKVLGEVCIERVAEVSILHADIHEVQVDVQTVAYQENNSIEHRIERIFSLPKVVRSVTA